MPVLEIPPDDAPRGTDREAVWIRLPPDEVSERLGHPYRVIDDEDGLGPVPRITFRIPDMPHAGIIMILYNPRREDRLFANFEERYLLRQMAVAVMDYLGFDPRTYELYPDLL